MDEKCKNCDEKQACIPFFCSRKHDDALQQRQQTDADCAGNGLPDIRADNRGIRVRLYDP